MHEDVVEGVRIASFALFTFLMVKNLNSLAIEVEIGAFLDSFLGNLSIFKLNVAKTAGFTVWVLLQFARLDGTVLGEGVEQRLLIYFRVDVADKYVGLWVQDTTFLEGGPDCCAINDRVVDAVRATFGFFGVKELEETVAVLALGLLVSSDDGLEDVVP